MKITPPQIAGRAAFEGVAWLSGRFSLGRRRRYCPIPPPKNPAYAYALIRDTGIVDVFRFLPVDATPRSLPLRTTFLFGRANDTLLAARVPRN